jgi:hypothetical protein
MISDIEFNNASFELSRFEEMLVKNKNENKEDLWEKKLELMDKYNPLLTDEEQMGYMNEYRAYLSKKIKESKLEEYI